MMNRYSAPLTAIGVSLVLAMTLSFGWANDEWTEVKDIQGRKLLIKIESVEGDNVKFSTRNGKSYTYAITKFSVTDRLALRKWKPAEGAESPVEEDSQLKPIDAEDGRTAFRTKHFEFDIIGTVSADQVEPFAPIFEAVHWAFSKLPIAIEPKPAASHFKVKLYTSFKDFEIASQETLAENQPATYNLDKDHVLLLL